LPGSIFLIKGPNGSGKTTFLKIIAGLLSPLSGMVKWNKIHIKEDMNTYNKYCASFHSTKHVLKPELTILENLEFWASITNHYELILPALQHFKLIEFADIKCQKLSSGLLQRASLARLIIRHTGLWIMDEPDAYLDLETKESLQKLITVKAREGGTVILSSHGLTEFPVTSTILLEDFKPQRHS